MSITPIQQLQQWANNNYAQCHCGSNGELLKVLCAAILSLNDQVVELQAQVKTIDTKLGIK